MVATWWSTPCFVAEDEKVSCVRSGNSARRRRKSSVAESMLDSLMELVRPRVYGYEQEVADLINQRFFDFHQQAIGTQEIRANDKECYLGCDKVPAKFLSITAESPHNLCHKCGWGCHLQLPWGGHVHSQCRQDVPLHTSVPPEMASLMSSSLPVWMVLIATSECRPFFEKTRHSRGC